MFHQFLINKKQKTFCLRLSIVDMNVDVVVVVLAPPPTPTVLLFLTTRRLVGLAVVEESTRSRATREEQSTSNSAETSDMGEADDADEAVVVSVAAVC